MHVEHVQLWLGVRHRRHVGENVSDRRVHRFQTNLVFVVGLCSLNPPWLPVILFSRDCFPSPDPTLSCFSKPLLWEDTIPPLIFEDSLASNCDDALSVSHMSYRAGRLTSHSANLKRRARRSYIRSRCFARSKDSCSGLRGFFALPNLEMLTCVEDSVYARQDKAQNS